MDENSSRLIYDIGLFDGEDTAYYLFRGYKVVAVDANPLMVERAKLRYAKEIQAGRLTILNVGMSEVPGEATFWISEVPEWSSFDKRVATRDGTPCRPIQVPVVPFSQLMAENGLPHYLKIDIEGNDSVCVKDLVTGSLPRYISVEAECVSDTTVLSDREATAMLELLKDAGYRKFKLVFQDGWTPARFGRTARLRMKLLNSLAYGRLRFPGLSSAVKKFTDSSRLEGLGFKFSRGASGPWGEDIPGDWMTFDEALFTYLRERHAFFSRDMPLYTFWYDWHATY